MSAAEPKGNGTDPALLAAFRRVESASAVGKFTAALVHQMRTPLHVIQSTAELLRERVPGEEVDLIERSVQRLVDLTDALRAYAQPEPARLAPADINAVLGRACSLAEAACKKQGIRLTKGFAPVPAVALDSDHLLGAFYDLMANAVEAMPEGGALTVSSAPAEGGVVVKVEDTGAGMEADVLARAGEPFFTTKGGTGLGLYVAKEMIGRHKARLTIDSAKGKGTRVTILFPENKSATAV